MAATAAPSPTAGPPRGATSFSPGVVALLCLLCVAPVYLCRLGTFGLWDPWETHYGEVARRMVRGNPGFYDITKGRMVTARPPDWMSPRWGYARGEDPEAFWSKPIWIFWAEGLFMRVLGVNEWAMRLPHALVACLAMALMALALARTFSRRAAVLATVALACAPQWILLAREAVTDMPFVGLMTAGLAFFLLAMQADPREDAAPWQRWLFWGAAGLSFVPQLFVLAVYFPPFPGPAPVSIVGTLHAVFWAGVGAVALWTLRHEKRRKALLYLAFYICVAHATLAKGLLGFLLPGAVLFTYVLVTGRWRLLREFEIPRGVLVFVCIAFPWYTGMIAGHGTPYVTRFFIQDHFQRLGTRIHGTYGPFSYFLAQLGYALFPWAGLALPAFAESAGALWRRFSASASPAAPATFAAAANGGPEGNTPPAAAVPDAPPPHEPADTRLYLLLWAAIAFTVFSLSVTKFHHYILPAVPPLAALVGVYLDDLFAGRAARPGLGLLVAAGLCAVVAFDLVGGGAVQLRRLMDLFVYNYTRPFPSATEFPGTDFKDLFFLKGWYATGYLTVGMVAALIIAAAGTLVPARAGKAIRALGLALAGLVAAVTVVWVTQVYIMRLTPHWSNKALIATYYAMRKGPDEHLVAWEMRWRGENFYSENECEEFEKGETSKKFFDRYKTGRHFFIMERGRLSRFKGMLPSEKARASVKIVDQSGDKFYLVMVDL